MPSPPAPTHEARIRTLTESQHGIVTRVQLLRAGVPRHVVDRRVGSGRLRPLHRGVYLLGDLAGALEPRHARPMAAVLACGDGALISHATAARLWRVVPPETGRPGPIHVTVPGADRGRRPGIRPHRVASVPGAHRAILDGIPLTSPARTLVDLAGHVRPRELEQALAEAEHRGLTDPREVARMLARRGPVPGAAELRRWVAGHERPAFTRSEAEARLLQLARRAGLPPPETNARVRGTEVDFLWPARGVVVEVDGFAYHASRRSFERDRRRDARLAAVGYRVMRVTWRQLDERPEAVLVDLAQALADSVRRPGRGPTTGQPAGRREPS